MDTQRAREYGNRPVWGFSDKIRKARTVMDMTQTEFARRINITSSTLAAYETGRAEPRFKNAQTLADRLQLLTGIDSAWFLTVDDPNEPDVNVKLPRLDSNQQPFGYKPNSHTGNVTHVTFGSLIDTGNTGNAEVVNLFG